MPFAGDYSCLKDTVYWTHWFWYSSTLLCAPVLGSCCTRFHWVHITLMSILSSTDACLFGLCPAFADCKLSSYEQVFLWGKQVVAPNVPGHWFFLCCGVSPSWLWRGVPVQFWSTLPRDESAPAEVCWSSTHWAACLFIRTWSTCWHILDCSMLLTMCAVNILSYQMACLLIVYWALWRSECF